MPVGHFFSGSGIDATDVSVCISVRAPLKQSICHIMYQAAEYSVRLGHCKDESFFFVCRGSTGRI